MAPGTSAAVALKATIIADNNPIPTIPFSRTAVSIPLSASTMPEKNDINTSIAALISAGILLAIPSRTPIKNLNAKSTICGVYATSALITPTTNCNAPSAICGTHSTNTLISVRTTDLTASPITGALSPIALQNATMPCPICPIIVGISPAIPVTITVSAATIAVAPAAPAAANAVNPTASAESPAPAASKPAPNARTPMPIKASAPDKARIVGTNGVRTAPATPRIVNAPAKVMRAFAIDATDIAPKTPRTGARTANAADATSNAAEPASVPFIKLRLMVNSPKATPRTVRPLTISSHCILPNLLIQFAIISNAAPTTTNPTPTPKVFLGINFNAAVTSRSATPIAVSPLPISSHCI